MIDNPFYNYLRNEQRDTTEAKSAMVESAERNASHLSTQKPTTAWPSIQEQEAYWKERDENLDKIESACAWFDEKDRPLPF